MYRVDVLLKIVYFRLIFFVGTLPVAIEAAASQICGCVAILDAVYIHEGDQIEVVSFLQRIEFVVFEEVLYDAFYR